VGLFDETLQMSEDQDWFMRAKELGISIQVIQETTLLLRKHKTNITREKGWKDVQILNVLRKSLHRRKQKPGDKAKPLPKLSDYEKD